MTHNGTASEGDEPAIARRVVGAAAGLLLYVHGLTPYLPLEAGAAPLVGFVGAFLLAWTTYAFVADLSIRGRHRRPNAEVLLVGSFFALLILVQGVVDPALGGGLSTEALAGMAAAVLVVLLLSAAYVARPELFRDPP